MLLQTVIKTDNEEVLFFDFCVSQTYLELEIFEKLKFKFLRFYCRYSEPVLFILKGGQGLNSSSNA